MNIQDLTVGLLGGTGPEGRGLAFRWARAGARVIIGSRSAERARTTAEELNQLLGGGSIRYGDNRAAIRGSQVVLITMPFEHAPATVEPLQGEFAANAVLVDATVPVSFEQGRVRYVELPEGSASEHLRARLNPSIPLVAAFKTLPAHLLEDPNEELDCDDFVASDSKEAKAIVMEAMAAIKGLRPIDAGFLESSRTLERMTVLAIGINRRYKIKTTRYRVIGV
jgi:NADPH-dependent F420 reductase